MQLPCCWVHQLGKIRPISSPPLAHPDETQLGPANTRHITPSRHASSHDYGIRSHEYPPPPCPPLARFNPVKPFAWLLFGILASIIALVWIIHMVIFMIIQPSITPFLNDYFLWFDKWFPLFGVLSVAIFSFYLLAACVKGCFKFGLRLVWFTLHPMKPNGTYMNSFLFNCG